MFFSSLNDLVSLSLSLFPDQQIPNISSLKEEEAIDEMSAQELSSLIQRLEAVAVRLEATQGGAGAAAGRTGTIPKTLQSNPV